MLIENQNDKVEGFLLRKIWYTFSQYIVSCRVREDIESGISVRIAKNLRGDRGRSPMPNSDANSVLLFGKRAI
jgi:hypothetical protein